MEMRVANRTEEKNPLIVELVGPAGAGKTTLSRALSRRNENIHVGAEIELRKLEYAPVFARSALPLLPLVLRGWQSDRWLTWEEIKYLVYLKGWPRVLRHQAARGGAAILLDHGPVFKLATLRAFGPQSLKAKTLEPWWNDMFRQWASMIDMVVWLDAPDSILEKRINSRKQPHAVKGKSELAVTQFLARYRISYEQILAELKNFGGPTLFQFDTSQTAIEQVADEVLRALHSSPAESERTVDVARLKNIMIS